MDVARRLALVSRRTVERRVGDFIGGLQYYR
jgi:hypothetical protein